MKKTNQNDLDFEMINLDETAGWNQLEIESALAESKNTEESFVFQGEITISEEELLSMGMAPEYDQTTVKEKLARDENVADMIDLIYNGIRFDFGYVYSASLNNLILVFRSDISFLRWEFSPCGLSVAKYSLIPMMADAFPSS